MLTQKGLSFARLLLLAEALGAAAIYYASVQLHHDPSFVLVATERWLNGATLYRDILEINPPWIFYLTAPSVIAAKVAGISPSTAFVLYTCAIAGVSLVWCWSLLGRVTSLSPRSRYAIHIACFASVLVIPGYNFGQREHLFVILALPYFLAAGFDPAGLELRSGERIALGLYAVLGVALKPYFLIPVALVTAALCWRHRSFRPVFEPANLSIAIGLIAYLILVATAHPAYFETIVPLGLSVYGTIADDTANLPVRSVLPLLLVATVATVGQPTPALRDSKIAFASVLFGLWSAFAVQRKTWDYQILPFESTALVVAVIVIALGRRRILSRPLHFAILATTPLVLLAAVWRDGPYANPYPAAFIDSLRKVAPDWRGKSVLVLTTNVSAAFPFINEVGADWVGRYPYQWLIAGARMRRSQVNCGNGGNLCSELDAVLDFARRTNVDDFAGHPPDIVLVDARASKSYMPDGPFDYVTFLDRDPRFPKIWRGYTKIDSVESYDVWLRSQPSATSLPLHLKGGGRLVTRECEWPGGWGSCPTGRQTTSVQPDG